MAGIIDELVAHLEQEQECYKGLNILATYKKEAIISKEIKQLSELTKKEEEFIGRLNLLKQKGEKLFKNIGLILGIVYQEVCITAICNELKDKSYSEELKGLRSEILQQIKELKSTNQMNKLLIEQSVEFIDFSITALMRSQANCLEAGYQKTGMEIEVDHTQNFFDYRQ